VKETGPIRIPIGLDMKEGGEITFTADLSGSLKDANIYLEDNLMQTITNMGTQGASYKTNVASGTKGTGRFFLFSGNTLTAALAVKQAELTVFTGKKNIFVEGEVSRNARLTLFSTDGRMVYDAKASDLRRNLVPTGGMPSGIYILNVADGSVRRPTKWWSPTINFSGTLKE